MESSVIEQYSFSERQVMIPVVILCGGMGMRLKEETEFRPKPMVEIGDRPILWHIMALYASWGFDRFILCLGFRSDVIKDYFLNYYLRTSDIRMTIGTGRPVSVLSDDLGDNWTVTLVNTGLEAMTGARLARVAKYIETDNFLLSYGDTLSDVDIRALYDYHLSCGKIGTVTGVRPPSRFGELAVDQFSRVASFDEKPVIPGMISGGFFAFSRRILEYLSTDDGCVLEEAPLRQLAADGQLMVRPHKGFWQGMDTIRDVVNLRRMYANGEHPWLKRRQTVREIAMSSGRPCA